MTQLRVRKRLRSSTVSKAVRNPAQVGAESEPVDANLTIVIEAWPLLSLETRAEITAMIRSVHQP
jgi:hypothetical protein